MNDRIERSDYGITTICIPASIYFDRSLSLLEKVILSDIRHLCELRGCFKTNNAFATFHNVSKSSVNRALANLAKRKLIAVKLVDNHVRTIALTQKYLDVYTSLSRAEGDCQNDMGVVKMTMGGGQNDKGGCQNDKGVGGQKPVHDVDGEQLRSRATARKSYTRVSRSNYGAAAPDPVAAGGLHPSDVDGAAAPDPAFLATNFIRQWKAVFPRVHDNKQATVISEERDAVVSFFKENPHRTVNDLIGLAVGAWMMPEEEDDRGTKTYWYCNKKSHRVKHFFKFLPEIEDQMEWKGTQEQHAKIHAALDKRFPPEWKTVAPRTTQKKSRS